MNKRLCYVVNADWYFQMHWLDRAKAAKASGFDVLVVTPVTDVKVCETIERQGIKVVPWRLSRSGRRISNELRSILQLRKVLKNEQPDLVHCITVKPNMYAFFLSLSLKLDLVLSVTGLGMLFTSERLVDRVTGWIVKHVYSCASRKHFVFFENGDDLKFIKDASFANPRNLKRLKGAGVSAQDYVYSPPIEVDGPLILFFAARLLSPKGLGVLVDAVRELNDAGYCVRLRVAGIMDAASPLAIPIGQIEKWSELPFFEFLGNRKDVPDLISRSHFVCLPSTYGEGIPRILIEAAAMGRAIITTDVPGCREICEDGFNGFLVPPGKSQPIVDAIIRVFSDLNQINAMSLNSKLLFDTGYDSETIIGRTLSAYDEVLSDKVM